MRQYKKPRDRVRDEPQCAGRRPPPPASLRPPLPRGADRGSREGKGVGAAGGRRGR